MTLPYRSVRRSIVLLLAVAAGVFTARATAEPQQGAAAAGLILGQVVDAATNRGVGESVVTLAAAPTPGSPPMPRARVMLPLAKFSPTVAADSHSLDFPRAGTR